MDLVLLIQRIVDGVELGAIYAPLALAIVLVKRTTGVINFAQGEMATISTFGTWYLVDAGLPLWLALAGAIGVSFWVGAALERGLASRLRADSPLPAVVVLVGLFIALNAISQELFGTDPRRLDSLFPRDVVDVAGVRVTVSAVCTIALLGAVSAGLYAGLRWTTAGIAMRAVASSPSSSQLAGVPVQRMLMLGWGLAASLGALAGALIAPKVFLEPNMMLPILIYAFAAATLGGLESPPGAILGALVVGMAESLIAGYVGVVGSSLRLASAFVVILVVLLVRPDGLFGRSDVARP